MFFSYLALDLIQEQLHMSWASFRGKMVSFVLVQESVSCLFVLSAIDRKLLHVLIKSIVF